jgi:hypothetical protein
MITLANAQDLEKLHSVISENIKNYGKDIGDIKWGSGLGKTPLKHNYVFALKQGVLILGQGEAPEKTPNRWVLSIALKEKYPEPQKPLDSAFEFNIPKAPNKKLALIFAKRGKSIEALHRGKLVVGKKPLHFDKLFEYYKNKPGRWPIIADEDTRYISLFTFDLEHFGHEQFFSFLVNVADFAAYVTSFKNKHRKKPSL